MSCGGVLAAVLALLLGTSSLAAGSERETVAAGKHAAVATDADLASATGLRILREGGNAVDAAVAIGYTLAVTFPSAGNIGGGGFMLVRLARGDAHFIDFRETAPAAARADMYLDRAGNVIPDRSIVGPLAAGVPGTVAGLEFARATYGTRTRFALMRDAIADAQRGFVLTPADAAAIARSRELLREFASTAAIFTHGGALLEAGARLRQPDLARTLRRIAADGVPGFYAGTVARELAAATRAAGGLISVADLRAYRVIERRPLTCRYRGATVITAPLPSSGGVTMCEILGIIAHDQPRSPMRSFANAQLEIEAERRAFADRNAQLGDPAFIASPVARLLDSAYLARLRASISAERATPSHEIHGGTISAHEGSNTTNYSVVDAAGNAVDVTYTLNNWFGSGFVAGRTGVVLNDEMDDFTAKPGVPNMFGLMQGRANAIAPEKRPLSSMSPTIIVDAAGRPELVTGAAGGPRIITTTLDIVRAVVDFSAPAGTAVAAPRMHMQWLPDVVYAERATFDAATVARFRAAGYRLRFGPAGSAANGVAIRPDGMRVGAHDPRVPTGSARAF